jgi:hypothetical protein
MPVNFNLAKIKSFNYEEVSIFNRDYYVFLEL